MGRTSNFSFPLPGRRRAHETKVHPEYLVVDQHHLSKAQRILGTGGDINIDSPSREESRSLRHKSSSMSITISDSTDDEEPQSISNSETEEILSERLSVRQEHPKLRGKPSSTLLGRPQNEDIGTESSSLTERLQKQPSSSTLRSYYDPQKIPLAISQQTSASSVRDLALRKGLKPVVPVPVPRSPLLQVESLHPSDARSSRSRGNAEIGVQHSHKKTPRLEIGRFFPKGRKDDSSMLSPQDAARSPSALSTASGNLPPRKLTKKEPRRSQRPPSRQEIPQGLGIRNGESAALHNLHDQYENMPYLTPLELPEMEQALNGSRSVPQTSRTATSHSVPATTEEAHSMPSKALLSIENTLHSSAARGWDSKSIASTSSRNTKTSKRSLFSHADLHASSVLSLSSDDESGEDDKGRTRIERIPPHTRRSTQQGNKSANDRGRSGAHRRNPSPVLKIKGPKKASAQTSTASRTYLTVPLPSPASLRISGPWASDGSRRSSGVLKEDTVPAAPSQSSQPRPSMLRRTSASSTASSNNGRMMAVTKQEEALLEALRQKRARMREHIIAEHETTKSPPKPEPKGPTPELKITTSEKDEKGEMAKGRILLYLDRPLSTDEAIETAEPSPDLSDFLSFGSDDEDDNATPRSSWIRARDIPRPDSSVGLRSEGRSSPITPKNGLRLSALGPPGVLANAHTIEPKPILPALALLEPGRLPAQIPVEEEEVIWGM